MLWREVFEQVVAVTGIEVFRMSPLRRVEPTRIKSNQVSVICFVNDRTGQNASDTGSGVARILSCGGTVCVVTISGRNHRNLYT